MLRICFEFGLHFVPLPFSKVWIFLGKCFVRALHKNKGMFVSKSQFEILGLKNIRNENWGEGMYTGNR